MPDEKTDFASKQRGRRDHYLSQGYLRGFIDPARENEDKPLWKLDIASRKWAERSPPNAYSRISLPPPGTAVPGGRVLSVMAWFQQLQSPEE
jgi:hypothetical protein